MHIIKLQLLKIVFVHFGGKEQIWVQLPKAPVATYLAICQNPHIPFTEHCSLYYREQTSRANQLAQLEAPFMGVRTRGLGDCSP